MSWKFDVRGKNAGKDGITTTEVVRFFRSEFAPVTTAEIKKAIAYAISKSHTEAAFVPVTLATSDGAYCGTILAIRVKNEADIRP